MNSERFFDGKRVTLIGLGLRSGVAVTRLLDDLGASVRISDLRTEEELAPALEQLKDREIELVLRGHPPDVLENTDLVVISPGVPWESSILDHARQRNIPILGELEIAAQVCHAPIIAITGTKGKSTTTAVLGKILESSGHFRKVLVGGNIGLAFSQEVRQLTCEDIAVIEVSSFQLESISQFHPSVSVVTNMKPDHLDRHGSMASYIAAKQRIFLNQTSEDFAVLNADDPIVREFAQQTRAHVCWFSTDATTRIRSLPSVSTQPPREKSLQAYLEQDVLILERAGSRQEICRKRDLRLVGTHNIANLLAACLVGGIYRVDPQTMRCILRSFRPPAHTLELVRQIGTVRFFNDSKATNVAATQAALEAFDPPILLIMGGYDKGNDYAPLIPLVQAKVSHLILMGPDTRKIRNALQDYAPTVDVPEMKTAVSVAAEHLAEGTTVLLSPACASFDLFEDYRQRGEMFRQEVMKLS